MSTGFTILLYHGVHADTLELGLRNSSGKHMAASRFSRQMEWLAANRPVVRVADIAAAYRNEATLPDGAVAVTFDDGFRNNLIDALPVLERWGIPATLYIATGFVGRDRMVWSDRLEAAILESSVRAVEFEGNVWPLTRGEDRQTAYNAIKARLKSMPYDRKDAAVDALVAALGPEPDAGHPLCAFLDWDEVRRLDGHHLMDLGAHTVDHVSLAKVAPEVMRDQIDRSVADLRRETGHCDFFSYPEGQADDYNEAVIAHLLGLGFDHAPSAMDGDNRFPDSPPFHWRRIMPGFAGRAFPFADL